MADQTEGAVTLAKQGSISFVGNVSERSLKFLFLVFVTNQISPSTYGIFSLGLSVVILLRGVGSLRLDRAIDYFVPMHLSKNEGGRAKATFFLVAKIVAVTSVLSGALLAASADALGSFFGKPALPGAVIMLSLALVTDIINNLIFRIFNSIKKMKYRVITKNFVKPATQFVLTAGLILFGFKLAGLLAGYLVASGLTLAVGAIISVRRVEWMDSVSTTPVSTRKLMSYSLPLTVAGIMHSVIGQIDFFVIGFFLESRDIGHYRIAYLFAGNLLLVTASAKPVFKPMIAESVSDTSLLLQRYRLTTRWLMLFTVPLGLTLALAPGVYVTLLFSQQYASAQWAAGILVAGYLVNISFGLEGTVLKGIGRTRLALLNSVVVITTNTVIDLVLVPRVGIEGAAVGTAVGLSVGGLAGVLGLLYIRGVHPYGGAFAKVVIAGGLAAVVTSLVVDQQALPAPILAVLIPSVLCTSYGVFLYILNPFNDDDTKVAERIDGYLGHQAVQRLLP